MEQKIPVVFEDNHLLIVQKPCNVGVQADSSGDPDMLTLLKADLKERYEKPGNVYLGLVHRLDRPVGGVMVFAKTSKAAERLSKQIKDGEMNRTYKAVTIGRPVPRTGMLENYLLKDKEANKVKVLDYNAPHSKRAILSYRELSYVEAPTLSLLSVQLQTGRAHQIRAQLSYAGYPVWGDQKYAGDSAKPGMQIALWSHTLSLIHPTKGERMTFVCDVPDKKPWTLLPNE